MRNFLWYRNVRLHYHVIFNIRAQACFLHLPLWGYIKIMNCDHYFHEEASKLTADTDFYVYQSLVLALCFLNGPQFREALGQALSAALRQIPPGSLDHTSVKLLSKSSLSSTQNSVACAFQVRIWKTTPPSHLSMIYMNVLVQILFQPNWLVLTVATNLVCSLHY